jgi:hypothetical protein
MFQAVSALMIYLKLQIVVFFFSVKNKCKYKKSLGIAYPALCSTVALEHFSPIFKVEDEECCLLGCHAL